VLQNYLYIKTMDIAYPNLCKPRAIAKRKDNS